MNFFRTLSLIALSVFIVSCGGKSQPTEPQKEEVATEVPGEYKNENLRFSLKYDPKLLALSVEDSTQVIFKGIGDNAEFRIHKDVRKGKKGEILSINECFDQDKIVKPGHRHAHATFRSDNYTISGRVGDTLYYQKSIYKGGGVLTAILTYTDAEKEVYNAYYIELFGSFE